MSTENKILAVKSLKKHTMIVLTQKKMQPVPMLSKAEEYYNIPHEDLTGAIKKLIPHMLVLADAIQEKDIAKADFSKFEATGFSIGGKEGQEGIQIMGYRKTKRGGTVNIVTPFTRFEEDDKTRYTLMDDVEKIVDEITAEAVLYLGGKKAVVNPNTKQGQIEGLNTDTVTKVKIAPEQGDKEKPNLAHGITPGQYINEMGKAPIVEMKGGEGIVTGKGKVRQTAENPSGETKAAK